MDRRYLLTGLTAALALGLEEPALAKIKWASKKLGSKSVLSDKTAQDGLRQMLTQGTAAAVAQVSKPDGYWGDSLIRIPLPKPMANMQNLLKPLGQSGILDDLHLRMNRAAETAAPVAKGLFIDAITSMTITDAAGIIRGGNTAGTDYLQRTTTPRLTTAFTPPMESAMQSTGAVDYLDRAIKRNNLESVVKTDAKTYLGTYAVGLALNGLFHYVGTEEIAIRRDPTKRATDLLKSLFG